MGSACNVYFGYSLHMNSRMAQALDHWMQPPDGLSASYRRFHFAASLVWPTATLWHVGFIFVFWAVGAAPLAIFNIGSVVLWLIVLWLHARGRFTWVLWLAYLEIIAHAIACVAIIGWATGFQYYLVVLAASVFLAPIGGYAVHTATSAALVLVFVGLHAVFADRMPPIELSPWVVETLFYANAVSLFLIVGLWSALYARAATIAETALAEEKAKSDEMASLLRRMFGRYVAPEVVEAMLENPAGLELGGEKRSVSIMMTDLRGFTALSERLAPEQVVQMLNTYFEVMIAIIDRHQGMVNEIIGDALLVLFGAPQPMPDRARRAVACAIEMQNGMAAVNARNRGAGLPELEMGIGLNDAEVVVGNVGSSQRSKYAAVGSGVNLASRIESYTVGGQILASESVLREAGDVLRVDDQRQIFPKGATVPLWVYAVGGIGGEFNLALDEVDATLLRLARRVPVRFEPMEGKAAGGALLDGAIVRLSRTSIDLETPASLAPMSNLRFNLQEVNEALAVRDFYGKVVQTGHPQSSVRIRITALPPEVSAYFEALRGYATAAG